jgi:hypothetical protein
MGQPIPQPLQDIIARLTEHATGHDLVARAMNGCRNWFLQEPGSLPYALSDVRIEFASQALYFSSALLSYPYIDTRLRLFVSEREIGYYRLITLLDGTDDDDYLVFEQPNPTETLAITQG